jgi:pimeloyl-ACP methyl ester carboxylesterase
MWNVGNALLDVAHVTNVHLPGYEGSPSLLPYDEDQALSAVESTLLGAGIVSPLVVGFSAGAARAFALAKRGKLGIRGIVSLGGLAQLTEAHRQAILANAAVARDHSVDLAPMFTSFFLSARGMANEAWVNEIKTWFSVIDRDELANEFEGYTRAPGVDLSDLNIPILARVGELDQVTPPAYSEDICKAAPKAELQIVPGAAHAIIVEDQEATNAAVRKFVLAV